MRGVILVVIALAGAAAGFTALSYIFWKKSAPVVVAAASPSPAAAPAMPTAQPLVQTPTRPAPAATPDTRRLAPPGVFYLLNRISVTTDSGVVGVAAGTQLLLLEKLEDGGLKVTDGPEDFVVAPSEVTNDLDSAARAGAKLHAGRPPVAVRREALPPRPIASPAATAQPPRAPEEEEAPAPETPPLP